MTQSGDWIVYRRNDGLWAKKRSGAKIATSVHPTQELAENSVKEMLETRGRTINGIDEKVQGKDTFFQTVIQSLLETNDTSS
jgi:hypothetical protein